MRGGWGVGGWGGHTSKQAQQCSQAVRMPCRGGLLGPQQSCMQLSFRQLTAQPLHRPDAHCCPPVWHWDYQPIPQCPRETAAHDACLFLHMVYGVARVVPDTHPPENQCHLGHRSIACPACCTSSIPPSVTVAAAHTPMAATPSPLTSVVCLRRLHSAAQHSAAGLLWMVRATHVW